MAWTERFVDSAASGGDGLDTVGFSLTGATWTVATLTLTKTGAFSAYTWANGDYIYLSSATAGETGVYLIASKTDSDSIVLNAAHSGGITSDQTDVVSGDGPWTWIEAGANYAAGHRINVKAGTYSVTDSNSRSTDGTNSNPVRFSGYSTIIGDLEDVPTTQLVDGTDMPLIQRTANYDLFTGDYTEIHSISFTNSTSGRPGLYMRSPGGSLRRCRIVTTGTAYNNYGLSLDNGTNARMTVDSCYISTPSTQAACRGVSIAVNNYPCIYNSIIDCPCIGIYTEEDLTLSHTIIKNCSIGIQFGENGSFFIMNCTIYNCSSHAIEVKSGVTPASSIFIARNYFSNIGGNAVYSQYVQSGFRIADNCYESITGTRIHSNISTAEVGALTDSSDEFVDAAGDDFTLNATSNAYGVLSLFEVDGPGSYSDIGAVQHEDAGGGGGMLRRSNQRGGF